MTSRRWVETAMLEAAIPSLYVENAFRVLKLSIAATPREVKRQVEKIELRRKLSKPKNGPGTLRALVPESQGSSRISSAGESGHSIDEYAIRHAAQRLGDPQSRLMDEIFWFWPLDSPSDGGDPAIESVLVGNYQEAADIWKMAEDRGVKASIANHNLAVFHHRAALDYVQASQQLQLSNQSRQDLEYRWREAHRRWELLHRQDDFWDGLALLIREFEDPRLTPNAASEVRRTLPSALLLLGARLLIAAAENGQTDQIPRYSSLIHGSPFRQEDQETAVRIAITPIRERISVACNSAEERTIEDPAHADDTVRSLLEGGSVSAELAIIDALLQEGHPTRVAIHDQAALQLLKCVVKFSNRTEDYKVAIDLLDRLKVIAESESATTNINEQIDAIKENASSDLRWYGPGYHDAPPDLFQELETARGQFELRNWDAAIAVLRKSLRTWKGEQSRPIISKPLAFCLYIRAGTSFTQAIRANTPEWGQPSHSQIEAVRAALQAAAKDLVEALELDSGNKDISESYDQIHSFASSARVSIPSKPRSARVATTAPATSGSGAAPPPSSRPYQRPAASSGGSGARGFVVAIGVITALVLAIAIGSNQPQSASSSNSGSNTGGVSSTSATRPPAPTRTRVPTRIPTRTPTGPDCYRWDRVSTNLRGRYECVYGRVVMVYDAEPYIQIIRFSRQPGHFLVLGENYYFEGVSVGQCIFIDGTIYQSASYLYMSIDDLSTEFANVQSSMCNS